MVIALWPYRDTLRSAEVANHQCLESRVSMAFPEPTARKTMALSIAQIPVNGMTAWSSIAAAPRLDPANTVAPCSPPNGDADRSTMIERLVRILQRNERLIAEQRALTDRLRRARAYLAEPGCNLRLGTAQLSYLRVKYSGVLAHLRANRREARDIVAGLDPDQVSLDSCSV